MAKLGIPITKLTPLLANKGWTLCIGAGTSIPMFPSWRSLVQSMLEKDFGSPLAAKLISPLAATFGLDALIQAGRDRLALGSEEFARLLSEQLYEGVKKTLSAKEWKTFSRALTSFHPGDMPIEMWKDFLTITESHYGSVTALPLARAVARAMNTNQRPSAILSFNAEPLLYALINSMVATSFEIDKRSGNNLKAILDRVTRSVSNRDADRIPFAFCHGLLPVEAKSSPKGTAVDKLVFSESEYLQLANSGFSWQSSIFFDSCMSRAVVFVGLSFSDPNLRRWLGIMHQNRLSELKIMGENVADSAPHYWLRPALTSAEERRWVESAVAHLGVRLVWLDTWDQSGLAIQKMLGIS